MVPGNLAAGAIRDVAKVRNGGDVMADSKIEDWLLARFHTVQKVAHVAGTRVGAARLFLVLEIRLFLFGSNFPAFIVEDNIAFGATPFDTPVC